MADYKGGETTGFQSPAQDHIEEVVDLAALLDLRKPGMYPVRVVGQNLKERGIDHNDILIADATADPEAGRVCVAMFGGEVILATLKRKNGEWFLLPSKGEPVPVTADVDVWAIIRALVRIDV
ncbi:S24 family peptidase [bacterium]|nr:S24 family peptidase [bacterium]